MTDVLLWPTPESLNEQNAATCWRPTHEAMLASRQGDKLRDKESAKRAVALADNWQENVKTYAPAGATHYKSTGAESMIFEPATGKTLITSHVEYAELPAQHGLSGWSPLRKGVG